MSDGLANRGRATDSRFPGQFAGPQAAIDDMVSYGITPAGDLMALQQQVNTEATQRHKRSTLADLSYETALGDAHDALTGLAEDLAGNTPRKGLKEMLTHNDRLRGLGVLLIALALVGLIVDYIMYPMSTAS